MGVERCDPRQQLVEQHPQAVDVTARINIQPAHLRLLRAHVSRGPDELLELGVNGLPRQLLLRCLGNTEVNDLRYRQPIMKRRQDVRGLDVPVDNPLLMRVLNRVTDLDEQIQPLAGGQVLLVAIPGDRNPFDQLHHEVRPPALGSPPIQHLSDVGMVHQRQRLALRLKSRHHLPGVHTQFDDLECHAPLDRHLLFGHVHHATAALPDLFQQLVAADDCPRPFGHWRFVQWGGGDFGGAFARGSVARLRILRWVSHASLVAGQ